MCASASGLPPSVFLCEAARMCRAELHCWHKLLGPGMLPLHWASPPLMLINLILSYNEFLCLRVRGGPGHEVERRVSERGRRTGGLAVVLVVIRVTRKAQSYQVKI